MVAQRFRPGDVVVCRKTKYSTRPGPRARNVFPCPRGDGYTYSVDKFWIVAVVNEDGTLLVATRRGKTHLVDPLSTSLRHANLWERIVHGGRLRELAQANQAATAER